NGTDAAPISTKPSGRNHPASANSNPTSPRTAASASSPASSRPLTDTTLLTPRSTLGIRVPVVSHRYCVATSTRDDDAGCDTHEPPDALQRMPPKLTVSTRYSEAWATSHRATVQPRADVTSVSIVGDPSSAAIASLR